MSVVAYIGLGANLGDAAASVQQAVRDINDLPGTTVVETSSLYRTAPVDANGPDYTNAVTKIHTSLSAHGCCALQGIEKQHGRTRPLPQRATHIRPGSALYGDESVDDAELTVPHPRMHERALCCIRCTN